MTQTRQTDDAQLPLAKIVGSTDLWVIDPDGATILTTGGVPEMFGCTSEEMATRTVFDLAAPESRHLTAKALESLRSGAAHVHERRFVHRDGSQRWALVNAKPFFDDDGTYAGAVLA